MSIIIQAGHKSSKSRQLMEKLYERGLSRPADSYTHKMTPEQVSETLYKVFAREDMSSANEKMADNVMIDFLLANLDSENWGWESDKNLASLEYWGEVEPDVRFILVFDHPKNVLNNLTSKKITIELLDQVMSDWVSYHQTMLGFFEKNQDTAILIEGAFALNNINSLGVQVKSIAKTIQLKSSWQVISESTTSIESSSVETQFQFNVVKDHIFTEIIKKYPEAIKMFNTLIDKASIKNSDLIYKTKSSSLDSLVESLNYLQLEEEKKSSLANIEKSLVKKDQENQRLNRELQESNSKRQDLENELKKMKSRNENPKNENTESEKKLLTTQLYKTQEQLEKYYLENKKLKQIEMPTRSLYYGAAERVKQDLPYRLGSVMIDKGKTPKGLITLPLVLIREYHNFGRDKLNLHLPKLEDYEDFDDAEKVKKHLSYRLGNVLLNNLDSGKSIPKLPIALMQEYKKFKASKYLGHTK